MMTVLRHVFAVARKEMRQVRRDTRTMALVLVLPLFFLWLFGYALNFDIRDVTLAVQDRDGSPESRALVAAFVESGYFSLVETTHDEAAIRRVIDRNAARAVLVIPADFATDLRNGRSVSVQAVVNGDNANTAGTVIGYLNAIVRSVSSQLVGEQAAAPPPPPPIVLEPRIWFNPELKSSFFLVLGLIAYIATLIAVVSTALSIVREKERGTFEQIRMAPLGTMSYVVGKVLPYLALSFTSVLVVLLAGMWLFGLPMRGSWVLLLGTTVLFLVAALAMGLMASSLADTQQAAFQIAALMSVLPTTILSGFMFPISSMPVAIQAATYLVPARYYLAALRAVVLKGAGLGAVLVDVACLAVFALAVLTLAAVRLRRQWHGT
ncbi:MAG: ABC transporter permease subunit [Luteitalea sp.]|nr:ABC transporter permease subunit [Luteitalea sp.]